MSLFENPSEIIECIYSSVFRNKIEFLVWPWEIEVRHIIQFAKKSRFASSAAHHHNGFFVGLFHLPARQNNVLAIGLLQQSRVARRRSVNGRQGFQHIRYHSDISLIPL